MASGKGQGLGGKGQRQGGLVSKSARSNAKGANKETTVTLSRMKGKTIIISNEASIFVKIISCFVWALQVV